ncbi:hypothetical protein BU17DRAFT_81827 [Hysterangium stoloniferum]|nr:hypothetical protein BU17DRAFT_81827 [Hysterangium stoloniferum]
MSSGVGRHQNVLAKPPAATTGSPGTSIFSPPSIQSPRLKAESPLSELPRISSSPSTNSRPSYDHVPVQWSFESTYGLFGGLQGPTGAPQHGSRLGQKKEPREGGGGVLGGSWFGRRKNKDEPKTKLRSESDRETSADASVRLPRPDPSLSITIKPDATPPREHELEVAPWMSSDPTTPTTNSLQQAPPRPSRSPLRQSPSTHSDDTVDWFSTPTIPPTNDTADWFSTPIIPLTNDTADWFSTPTIPPIDATLSDGSTERSRLPHFRGPLSPIAASNLPTPNGSRAPSPTTDTLPRRPSTNLLHTTPRRDTIPSLSRRGPPPSTIVKTPSRRPATSSGVSSLHDQERSVFRGETPASYNNFPSSISSFSHFSEAICSTTTSPSTSTVSLTQDRTQRGETLTESLKIKMRHAREKGFKVKSGKRHHPQRKEEAPYPRDYERKTIDHDRWEHIFAVRLAKRSTFYSFPTPPQKVLDLGCGSGEWILECAREWKDTSFTGLDLVPLQPDLMRLGRADLVRRIKWVVGNFLHKLPFEDGEFDFVHVRRVARGVPEDRWDLLFEEITRVLKKGGAFEMLEEDLFFPGSITTADDEGVQEYSDEEHQNEEEEQMVKRPGTTRPQTAPSSDMQEQTSKDPLRTDVGLMQNGTRGHTPAQGNQTISNGVNRTTMGRHASNTGIPVTKNVHNTSAAPRDHRQRLSLDSWRPPSNGQTVADILSGPTDVHFEGDDDLFHPHVNPIMNPRDHSVLEMAYNELHAARFINLSPLSVLSSMLGLHFKDVRSHEPIQVLFPSTPSAKKKTGGASNQPLSLTSNLLSAPPCPSSTSSSGSRRQSHSPAKLQRRDPSITFPGIELRPLGMVMTRDSSRMPSKEWGFEGSILHMHLSARVSEVLSCSEEMWELIQDAGTSPERWRNSALAALADVTREQWEDCLARYQMDMHDKVSLGRVCLDQLGWPMPPVARTLERKAFDEAVERWENQRKLREEQACPRKKKKHAHPVSRVFRVFTARKE